MKPNGLELYIHIPFCVRKCAYCDFLSFPADEDTIQRYVDAVCSEIAVAGENNKKDAETVFFGGGTPSLLSFTQFEQIILALRSSFHITDDAEITVECNPGTVDEEKMTAMRSLGVNRISFGLQSADPDELSMLGRIHTWHEFEESFICARKTGFKNINVDLMLGLPVRDPAKAGKRSHLKETIEKVLQLDPEHISAYSLIVEEETPLALRIREGLLSMPGDEADRRQYRSAVRLLKSYGYEQYEISNFARPGFACRHNEGYWTGAEYLGIGLGASGYYQGVRYRNTKNMEVYLNQMQHVTSSAGFAPAARDYHEVSEKEQIEEFMFLGLRRIAGVSDAEFRERFHLDLSDVYGRELFRLREERLIKRAKGSWALTAKGIDVSNYVLASFMLDDMPLPVHRVSVRELVEFMLRRGDLNRMNQGGVSPLEAMQLGAAIHRKLQSERPIGYEAEVPLSVALDLEQVRLTVEGRADGIFKHDDLPFIEEIKSVSGTVHKKDGPNDIHLAQAKCYAAIYAQKNASKTIGIRITYCHTETKRIIQWDDVFDAAELWDWFLKLTSDYRKWALLRVTDQRDRDVSIRELKFPFAYREGQKRLVSGIYRTIKQGKQLFVQAPTGSGKTIAALYPSIKALGEGEASRVWYLTARTVTRTVAQDTMSMMMNQGLRIRSVTLTALERICLNEEAACDPEACSYAKGHYDRINEALYDLLTSTHLMDRAAIVRIAEEHHVCPYALERDAASFCDVVICDYNYVLDPVARLNDYFLNGRKKNDLFLIDEAHNLIERARGMYSASVAKSDVLALRRKLKGMKGDESFNRGKDKLISQLTKLNQILLDWKGELFTITEIKSHEAPMGQMTHLRFGMDHLRELCAREQILLPEEFWNLYFDVSHFQNMFELMDERFCLYVQTGRRGKVSLHLYCLDPSVMLSSYLLQGRATVFYSATLLPIPYYEKLLTSSDKIYDMYAESPFDPNHLLILIGEDVTSLYKERSEAMYRNYARYITEAVQAQAGHYIVYFPSYHFMEQVYRYLPHSEDDHFNWMAQQPDMTEQEKERFLEEFERHSENKTLVGLCVLGGAFAEGIDLTGQKLIGVIIIGTGIPQVGNRLNLTQRYFDQLDMDGFSYTYVYPGFNKVMQAVGRVIRTAKDVGFALLLDTRFSQRRYRRLFPREWQRIETCRLETVTGKLEDFWGDQS